MPKGCKGICCGFKRLQQRNLRKGPGKQEIWWGGGLGQAGLEGNETRTWAVVGWRRQEYTCVSFEHLNAALGMPLQQDSSCQDRPSIAPCVWAFHAAVT